MDKLMKDREKFVIGDVVRISVWRRIPNIDRPWLLTKGSERGPGVFCLVDLETKTPVPFSSYYRGSRDGYVHESRVDRKDAFLSAASHVKRRADGEE